MQSAVNWALLGLVIERPSYAYELAHRFERTYDSTLTLSSVSHIYTALASLKDRALIEEIPGTRVGRQPKPRYRATAKGLADYGEWLVSQLGEDLRRQRLFVLQLSALLRDPESALEILDRYERACLGEAGSAPSSWRERAADDSATSLVERLTVEDARLELDAKLAWVQYARRELLALLPARAAGR